MIMHGHKWYKWSVHKMNPGRYTGYCYPLQPDTYEYDRLIKGRPEPNVCNHVVAQKQVGMIYFIAEEVMDPERKEQNVISSMMKMLKRLNRL